MKKLKLVALTAMLFSSLVVSKASASDGDKIWLYAYGGSSGDNLSNVFQSTDGGYVLGGYSLSSNGDVPANKGSNDFIIGKVNQTGTLQWLKNYGGSSVDQIMDIIPSKDGGILFTGFSNSSDGDITSPKGLNDGIIGKTDANGNLLWLKNYGGTSSDLFHTIRELPDGSIITSGISNSSDGDITEAKGSYDIIVAKFDNNGNRIWIKNFGGTGSESFGKMQLTNDGGFIVVGNVSTPGGDIPTIRGMTDVFAVKLDANGNKQWSNTYGGTDSDAAYDVIQTSSGGYAIVGNTYSVNGDFTGNKGGADGFIIKLDSGGTVESTQLYGGTGTDTLRAILELKDGSFVVVGSSSSTNGDITGTKGSTDAWVMNIAKNGNVKWSKNYGGSGVDNANGLFTDASGNIMLFGTTMSSDGDIVNPKGSTDFMLAKLEYSTNKSVVSIGLQGGSLALTQPSISVPFNPITINGQNQTTNAAFSSFKVSDFTGTTSGWKLSVSATQFLEKAPDGTWDTEGTRLALPNGSLTLKPISTITPTAGNATPPKSRIASQVAIDGLGSTILLSADPGEGMDEYTVAFPVNALTLALTPSLKVDNINYAGSPTIYESVITWAIVTGP